MLITAGSLAASILGTDRTVERYHCSYGLDRRYVEALRNGGLRFTGVDDTGVLQDLQLLRRSRERIFAAAHEIGQKLSDRRMLGRACFGFLRELADDREHRSFEEHRA